jgi:predicted nucleotidyltransferase
MNALITQKLPELMALCKKHHVAVMYLFGSATTNAFNPQSDIDLLISFQKGLTPQQYADNYFDLVHELEELFGRNVDLITENSLSNPYFIESVDSTKQLIYAA